MTSENMKKIDLNNGRVQNQLIHDAEVVGFSKNNDGTFNIDLISESKVKLQLKLSGIKRMVGNSLGIQNIILDLYVLSGADAKKEIEEKSAILNLQKEALSALDFNQLSFVQIAPSNGLELFAICRSVDLIEYQ